MTFPGTDIRIFSCLLLQVIQAQSSGLLEPVLGTYIPTQDRAHSSFEDIEKKYKVVFFVCGFHIIYISSQFTRFPLRLLLPRKPVPSMCVVGNIFVLALLRKMN